jgi:hypothetical protein
MGLLINKESIEFQRDLLKFSMASNSDLAKSLKNTFKKLSCDESSSLIDESLQKKLLTDSKHNVTASLLIANQSGLVNLPHVQWMYLKYAEKLMPESLEIKELIAQSKEIYEKKLPFVLNINNYIQSLEDKYGAIIPKNLPRYNIPILYTKALLQLLHTRQLNSFLGLSLQATKKFGNKFLHHLANALFEMGETNEGLKSLMALTFLEPLKAYIG